MGVDDKKAQRAKTEQSRATAKAERIKRVESDHRTKKAPINLAKLGAREDI